MIRLRIATALILCGACAFAWAQKESLLIGSGDLVTIQVLEAPELTQHVRVTDAGYINLLVGGDVKLAGLTPEEAAASVKQALIDGHYLLTPHVVVTDDQQVTQNVTVLGQVRNPGAFPIETPRTVLDVLALAGGVTDVADRRITIQRHDSGEKIEYFLSNKSSTALNESVKVDPGDTILVPKIDVVYIMGDVARPGGYPMATNDGKLSLLQAVAMAGSTQTSAVPNATRLIRKQSDGTFVEMKVALSRMAKGKQADIALRPDDIVYVPFSYLRNMATNLTGLVAAASTAVIYRY